MISRNTLEPYFLENLLVELSIVAFLHIRVYLEGLGNLLVELSIVTFLHFRVLLEGLGNLLVELSFVAFLRCTFRSRVLSMFVA